MSNELKANIYAPKLPWNCWRVDELGSNVMQFLLAEEPYYNRWAQKWYEIFQFIFGNSGIRWNKGGDFAMDVDTLRRRNPAVSHKAQTNLARVIVEALGSFLYGSLPDWETEATDESSVMAKRMATIVEKVLDAYMQRLLMDDEFYVAAMILATYGQVGAMVSWRKNAGSIIEMPAWHKIKAPIFTNWMAPNAMTGGLIESIVQAMGSDGQPMFEERWEPKMDEMGRQIINKMFSGDVCVDILTPFEYRKTLGAYGLHRAKHMCRLRLLDYDDYLDEMSHVQGKTKFFNDIRPIHQEPISYSMAIKHFQRMHLTTPPLVKENHQSNENVYNAALFKHKVFMVDWYDKPHEKKWPTGRRIIITNGKCTHVTVPDYNTNKRDGWHPFAEAQWMKIAPSGMASGPLNDVVTKNRELNLKDGLISTATRRNMGSHTLLKIGSGFEKDHFTGEPGSIIEGNDVMGVRILHDDMPIAPIISKFREMDKEDMFDLSGAADAMRGEPSKGASSGYQERQRQEREEKRLTPARQNFEKFSSTIGEKIFTCLKQNAIKLDDNVVGFIKRSAAGKFQIQDVVAMMSSPMDFGVDIRVKPSSMAVKSKASMQATLQELVGAVPALAQRLNNAEVLDTYLKFFDAEVLRDGSAAHRERAGRENEVFADLMRLGPNAEGIKLPVAVFEDDHMIHQDKHINWFLENADEVMSNEWLFNQFLLHLNVHRIMGEEQMGQQLPGTSLLVPGMMAQARQMPPPTGQQSMQYTQMRQARDQGGANPQAPSQPAQPGSGGPPQTDPNAPAQNTPTARTQGGKTNAA